VSEASTGAELPPRWGLGDALLATVLSLVAAVVVGGVVLAVAGWETGEDTPLWGAGLLQLPLWLGLLGVPWLAARRKGSGSLRRDFGLRMRWTDVPLGLAVGLATQIAFVIVIQIAYDVLGIDTDKVGETARELGDRATDPLGVICLFIIVVVGAPIVEEVCYRGLWLRAAERRWGTFAGVVVSSTVFGVIHLQPYDTPVLIGIGAVLAWLTVRTGRLGPAIWAHVAFNLTAFVSIVG
jgi:membrane protease YdiL (CAAX protease family)